MEQSKQIKPKDSRYVLAKVHLIDEDIAFTFEPIQYCNKLDRLTVKGYPFIKAKPISSFSVGIEFEYKDIEPFILSR